VDKSWGRTCAGTRLIGCGGAEVGECHHGHGADSVGSVGSGVGSGGSGGIKF
jgi:hypothetical protein